MLKKILLLIPLFFCLVHLTAQEKNNIKLVIETGLLPLSEDSPNLGLFLNVEPKIKILENTFIGLRFGLTINSHTFETDDSFQFNIDEEFDNAILSFLPTVDYYLNEHHARPYIGFGLGLHLSPNYIDVFQVGMADVLAGSVDNRIGFLLRGGVELGKLRFGGEYNFVPRADIVLPNSKVIGAVGNSYFGLSIGLSLGFAVREK